MRIFNRLSKRVLAGVTALALVVSVATPVFAAFGPSRPTKAYGPGVTGFDHVTFNSFTGVPNGIGDERDFMRGVQVGRDSVWSDPVNNVTQDATVEAKIYIHNGADASLNDQPGNPGIAKNVKVRVALPTGAKKTHEATSYISADNAQPKEVFDTLTMTGANGGFFELAYVPGSAKLHKGGSTTALSDNLVTSGVNIGDIKGCFEYIQEITFRMKVKMPRYTVKKQITTPGSTDWKESLNAKPGDTVSWLVTFENVGQTELKNVKVVDEVPAGLTVVPGTVKLVNTNFPTGWAYPDTAIQANGRQINVDIGTYPAGSGAYVTFRTKIADAKDLKCGDTKIVNKAFATPEGYGAIWDDANVNVNKECQPEQPEEPEQPEVLPETGPANLIGIFAATTVAGAVAHRFVLSRRSY